MPLLSKTTSSRLQVIGVLELVGKPGAAGGLDPQPQPDALAPTGEVRLDMRGGSPTVSEIAMFLPLRQRCLAAAERCPLQTEPTVAAAAAAESATPADACLR